MEPNQWQYGQLSEAGQLNNSLITFDVYGKGTLHSVPGGRDNTAWQKLVADLGEDGWIFCSVLAQGWLFRRPLTTPLEIPDLPAVQFGG